ncbi:hypothetical protein TNIN_170591 [Trichonephila inaurata madagascariensis]|uniref:Sialin n=1 Tax=Trichonephila inaurata madagascariensis TaxID=2747483 RepID=A0A8X6YHL0_9ARAC|nr:hypothetical protein TNIN_170591 [Trichonephila inaurata madagascariensis]
MERDMEAPYIERIPILRRQKKGCFSNIPKRFVLVLLGFLGIINVYAMRVNLSVAMVAMVQQTTDPVDIQSPDVACKELIPPMDTGNSSFPHKRGDFDWDSSTQATILGSFFYGYVVTQIPGGILAEKYGAKWLFGIGVLVTSLFTLLTPLAAELGVSYLVFVRVMEGLGEGVTYPAMNVMIGRWAPKVERSRMSAIIYTGSAVGNVFSFALSGIISANIGWPSVFYIFGALGVIWTVFWLLFIYETPEKHPYISEEEIKVIRYGQDNKTWEKSPTPWKSILTSFSVWALVLTHFGQNWGFYTLLTELPTYLASILHFNIKKNGIVSSLPYLTQAVFAILGSCMADYLRKSGRFRINVIRKTFNSFAFFVPAICVGLVGFVGCEPNIIIALFTLAMGFNGFMHSGFNVTHVDMSPEFSGTLMGLTNCIANLTGFLAPLYVGFITESGQTVENWTYVFVTTSIVFLVSGVIYNAFCTAELQPWGKSKSEDRRPSDDDRAPIIEDPS